MSVKTETIEFERGVIVFEIPYGRELFHRVLIKVLEELEPTFVIQEFTEGLDEDDQLGFRIFTYQNQRKYGHEFVYNMSEDVFPIESGLRFALEHLIERMEEDNA